MELLWKIVHGGGGGEWVDQRTVNNFLLSLTICLTYFKSVFQGMSVLHIVSLNWPLS